MNRIRVWGLSAALAVGMAGSAVAADPPAEKPSLMKRMFGPSPKKPGPTVPQRPITISAPLPPDQLAEALRAEQDAYLRRVSVCTELRRVAVERGDEPLARQADELERQAGAVYNARVAALGVSKTKSPLPEPTVASGDMRRDPITGRTAADRLLAPAAPVPGTTTAQLPREVKP
jgi:hypothetical protein